MSLTFRELQTASANRSPQIFPQCKNWTISDWGLALAGETGEHCNFLKKMNRLTASGNPLEGEQQAEYLERRKQAGLELADVVSYAALIADKLGFNLDELVVEKFNKVSQELGSNITLRNE